MPNQYTPNDNPIPIASGIYRITCIATGKIYIGSAINLRIRLKNHFTTLRQNRHKNPKLQRAYTKYGPDAFQFEIIELILLPDLLTAREQYWINKLNPWFNIARVAGSNLRMKQTPEAIEKSRIARTGMKRTPEQCENIGASRRGKPSTNLGRKASPETIERLRLSHLDKKQSPESNLRRAETQRGKGRSAEAIDKTMKNYILTSPDGTEYFVHGLKSFCQSHNLSASALSQVVKGKHQHSKGWKARYA